ncbi:energy-coupling factor transporter transmembrane protein EcfT [Halobaculum sp. MBLA0143]|uniref:energy-coupling factor transporter transmembrane component T family protein n=1 Tax=Halobaculum sp. MBLA0143 TaxID=3079933 RepID=UPI00352536AD
MSRLDPRTKLALQAGFAAAVFAHTTPRGLATATVLVAVAVFSVGVSPVALLRPYVFLTPFLVVGPAFAAARLGEPWLVPGDAVGPALASYRTLLLLAVGALYVRTTPVRESEAAVQRLVPGRAGRLLGVALGLVFRFLPLIRRELRATRAAMRLRLGAERPLADRMRLLTATSLVRTLRRADRLADALRVRCLAWNPTLPRLRFGPADAVGLGVAAGLVALAVLPATGG